MQGDGDALLDPVIPSEPCWRVGDAVETIQTSKARGKRRISVRLARRACGTNGFGGLEKERMLENDDTYSISEDALGKR